MSNKPLPVAAKKPEPAAPKQAPVLSVFEASLLHAAFTPRELDTLKRVCRDADNELGLKALAAGLARGGK